MTQDTRGGDEADHDEADHEKDRDAELRGLRLRAYGPDADIESDPAALARLRELEGMRLAAPVPSSAGSASEGASPPPLPPRPPLPSPSGESGVPVADGAETSAPAAPAWRRRIARWSRTPRAIAIVAIALVVVLVLAVLPRLFGDRPDASLRVDPAYADEQLSTDYRLILRQIGANMDDFERFEDFGDLQVWGTPAAAPVRCLLVFDGPQDVRTFSCVPRGLDPVADMLVYPGSPVPGDLEELFPDAGGGTAVRFSLLGESVEVRVVLADSELELS